MRFSQIKDSAPLQAKTPLTLSGGSIYKTKEIDVVKKNNF